MMYVVFLKRLPSIAADDDVVHLFDGGNILGQRYLSQFVVDDDDDDTKDKQKTSMTGGRRRPNGMD